MSAVGFYIFYGFIWLFTWLPLRVQYLFADFMYFLGFYIVGYRKRITLENLTNAFPEKSREEVIQIAKKFYRHLFDMFIESMASLHIPFREIDRRVKFKNLELIEKYYNEKRHLIVVGGHYGNWEWTIHVPHRIKYKVLPIYKRLRDKRFDNLYRRLRARFGTEPVEMHKTIRTILDYKAKGILTLTYFIGDQRPFRTNIQHWVTFLNQDTPVFLGAEKIAVKLDSPVIFVHISKVKRGYYDVIFSNIEEYPGTTSEFEITEKFMKILEGRIREEPEFWLWSHKRWKYNKADFQ